MQTLREFTTSVFYGPAHSYLFFCIIITVYDVLLFFFFFFQAEDGIRDVAVTGVQTCALPIYAVLVDDQLAQLGVAVLLDDVDEVVLGDEARHAGMEREGADAQAVELMTARLRSEERRVGKEWRSRGAR